MLWATKSEVAGHVMATKSEVAGQVMGSQE